MTALAEDWTAYHTPETVRQEFTPEGHVERRPLLDKPSKPNPILNQLMDEALCSILLVSDGAVAALKERTTGSKAGTIAPTSDLAAIVNDFDMRFEACKTHRQRLAVIKDAQAMSTILRYAPDRSMVRGTSEWKEAIAQDPRSSRVLADVWGVGKSTIARIKKEYQQRPHEPMIVQRGKKYSVKERENVNRDRAKAEAAALVAAVEEICVVS